MAQQSTLDIEKYINSLAQSVLDEADPLCTEPTKTSRPGSVPYPQAQGESNTLRGRKPSEISPAAPPEPADPDQELVWMDWAEWQAQMLNRLFLEQGKACVPGKITAATVRHGERRGK